MSLTLIARVFRAKMLVSLRSYVPLVNLIGIIFQIADDYLNLQSDAVCEVVVKYLALDFDADL